MIHLRTLGCLELRHEDGRELRSVLAQPKRFAVLAYLAASPGFHRRDTLLGLFWPESSEDAARASLRTALSVLRRSMGEEAVVGRGNTEVGIDRDRLWCDVVAFEEALAAGELEQALQLYRGELLEGFYIPEAPGFERWLEERRSELRRRAADAARRLAECNEAAACPRVATEWARRAVTLAPDDEEARRRLIALLDQSGDRTGAIRAYEEFALRLRSEFDVEPAPETQALIRTLRASGSMPRLPITAPEPMPEPVLSDSHSPDVEIGGAAGAVPARAGSTGSNSAAVAGSRGLSLRARRMRAIVGATLVLVISLAAVLGLSGRPSPPTAMRLVNPFPPEDSAVSSIAVLAFADMSADSDQEYFADGISEEIINALTRVEGLRVVARTSAFSYKGRNTDVREIGQRLGVGAVLEGSVRKSEDQVRITAQLIDARTGYHLWSETYDRQASDVFAIQDEISDAITRTLTGRYVGAGGGPRASWPTRDAEAYDHYLRGLHFVKRGTPEDLRKAVRQFEAAFGKDPRLAAAHAGLADAYMQFPTLGLSSPRDAFGLARPAARRAVELDESLAEAHAALARVQFEGDWDFAAAGRSYERAIRLNPNFALANRYPFYLVAVGRLDEAIRLTRRALQLDPISPWANSRYGLMLYFDRQYDRAIEHLLQTLELEPTDFYTRWYLGLAYIQARRYDEAIEALQAAVMLSGGSPLVRATLGCAYARSGRREEAMRIRHELSTIDNRLYLRPQGMIFLLSDLGEREEAFRWLEATVEDRSSHPYVLTTEPLLDPLRSDPRFPRLLARAGLR